MNSEQKMSVMSAAGNRKGFTLIEMAIVLVIIGIIIGAIVKGQDLIANAQAKQLTSAVNSWRSLAYAYMDRNGRLPGDASRNGVIGDVAATERVDAATSIAEIVNTMSNAPANPVIIGGMSFWVYFGNIPAAVGTRNALVICKDAACATTFTADELEIIKALDTAIDGAADAGLGQVRGATAVTLVGALTAQNARTNDVVTTATVGNVTVAGATALWLPASNYLAAVWAFDRPY
jgi:prepilin-type N-terminal cleavage/methylation domain-containing protein